MRINTPLNDNDYRELKKESKEVLGASGYLTPPFGQSTNDYVEVHLLDTDGNFLEKFNSDHTTFEDDTRECAEKVGFTWVKTYKLQLSSQEQGSKWEPVFLLQKRQ